VRVSLAPGDRLLLCSDGLWDEISHSDIAAMLADSASTLELATRLVDTAIAAGGNDNITAVVYRHSEAKD
jgi:serine/threonine protein phosphatase PrpC